MPGCSAKQLQDLLRGIERDIQACRLELEKLTRYADTLREMAADPRYGDGTGEPSEVEAAPEQPVRPRGRAASQETKLVRNSLYEVLREAGGAMHGRELLDALSARNIEVVGQDPLNNVRSHLSHDQRFRPIGGGHWDLASRVGPSEAENSAASTTQTAPASSWTASRARLPTRPPVSHSWNNGLSRAQRESAHDNDLDVIVASRADSLPQDAPYRHASAAPVTEPRDDEDLDPFDPPF